jgi:hypothetical protein
MADHFEYAGKTGMAVFYRPPGSKHCWLRRIRKIFCHSQPILRPVFFVGYRIEQYAQSTHGQPFHTEFASVVPDQIFPSISLLYCVLFYRMAYSHF